MSIHLPKFFSRDVGEKILSSLENWKDSESLHDPLVWRKTIPELASLDYKSNLPEQLGPLNTRELMEAFKFFGRISLDLRDVPGLGHGRVFLASKKQNRFRLQLEEISTGRSFAAICITEEGGGSDLHAIKTTASRTADGYELNGQKKYVARLRQSDVFIVFANVKGVDQGLTAFMIEESNPGVRVADIEAMGLRGISWGQLDLDRVRVPAKNRIGGEGQGFSIFSTHFSFWRCAMAAAAIGAAEKALDKAKERLRTRSAFSGPIGRFTHLQQDFAKHASRLYMAWLLTQNTARRIELKQYSYVDAAMAKAESVEASLAAVQWSMLVHGAYGYSAEAHLEKSLRDLLGLRIADGTTDVLRGQVARGILGEELYSLSIGRDVNLFSPARERQLW
ncbi:acyl-CoA dehydrogenase [Xanthomonas translucens pv. translucens]|uniref:Medium-chain specific acyl-CoA dehydrogenase, mitochondrial n=2 Tax=Xanthomonas campestris pv. translucens TaxID=343 RepID=A0ABW9L4I6_XANCT|nr:acyl-CoA dehydrogenase [Xanthomonas translucens]QSQ35274.1 acyl-CoA dehydrogenase [Xanthomonas translucens pv. translucens]QSQ44086.1 acyl-CoA dehydrogenase [Xanthomonas translucens pv. translucens]